MKYKPDQIDKTTIVVFIILLLASAAIYYVRYKKSEDENMYLKAVSECSYGLGMGGLTKKYEDEGYETKEDCIESKFDLFKKVGI